MVLHITINSFDYDNEKILNRLKDFFTHKKYKCCVVVEPLCCEATQIEYNYDLKTHEKLLLRAFNHSFSFYYEDWSDYDIVLWNNNVIMDYYLTSEPLFVKQINRYLPQMDLHIIISEKTLTNIPKNYKIQYIQPLSDFDKLIQEIITTCFDNLPKCNWCPRIFKPSKHYKKYCSDKCREASLEHQYRENNRNYYNRYKNVLSEKEKGGLGSKNANLHSKADPNPIEELRKVRNAKKALGL